MSASAATWKRIAAQLKESRPDAESATSPLILESWRRSHRAGIDPAGEVQLRKVATVELLRRLSANRLLLHAAADLLDRFSASMGATRHVIYLADADAIVLLSRGTDVLMQSFGLRPGFDWSEAAMGTNGAGTAIASRSPVAVVGPEHWLLPFRDASCLGAPVFGPDGAVAGAVDLSTNVSDCDPSELFRVIQLARDIEDRLRAL